MVKFNFSRELEKANKHAKLSCSKWNKCRFTRRIHRAAYRKMAEKYWHSADHQIKMELYLSGRHEINTYPWPYSDKGFANWPESDQSDDYTLISDQSGCVVKYATSYCAWKIYEATGEWPTKKSNVRLDAKNWIQFLAEAGYTKQVSGVSLRNGAHYVGIDPNRGEWGVVVWFEAIQGDRLEYSTYYNKQYYYGLGFAKDFEWVEISKSCV